jgi:hypothetical protein
VKTRHFVRDADGLLDQALSLVQNPEQGRGVVVLHQRALPLAEGIDLTEQSQLLAHERVQLFDGRSVFVMWTNGHP